MPYILNKTNGTIVATVQDASLDSSTDLTFLGKNYAGYGEVQNENFLKLLENFANITAPKKPIEGQLWFDSSNKTIQAYDGVNWRRIAKLEVSNTTRPDSVKNVEAGDLWYEEKEQQLYVYNGLDYRLIGPLTGADTQAQFKGSYEVSDEDLGKKYNIKAVVGVNEEVVAVISAETYTVKGDGGSESYPLYPATQIVKRGINLIGADAATGISAVNTTSGSIFWGTAAHSLRSEFATLSLGISSSLGNTSLDIEYPVSFLTTGTTSTSYYSDSFTFNPYQNRLTATFFDGIASSARYADLAERYSSDKVYESGTVVILGGTKEITLTNIRADTSVAGVISDKPAYMMNSTAGDDDTHPYVALKGRVKCKVIGNIKKGQLLVSSNLSGYAEAYKDGDHPHAVIGKSLEDFQGDQGLIEIKI